MIGAPEFLILLTLRHLRKAYAVQIEVFLLQWYVLYYLNI